MTELLTKRERENIERIKTEKWKRMNDAFPPTNKGGIGLEAFMAALRKEKVYEYEVIGFRGVVEKRQKVFRCKGTGIVFCKIGNEVIVGQANNRYPE